MARFFSRKAKITLIWVLTALVIGAVIAFFLPLLLGYQLR